jgi:hypothetical protein
MKHTATLAIAALLSGCSALTPVDNRSPEQIKASAADRSVKVTCVLVTTPWGPQRTVVMELDRQSVNSGVVRSSENCLLEIIAEPKQKSTTQ